MRDRDRSFRCVVLVGLAGLVMIGLARELAAKPLGEGDLATLLKVGIGDDAILAKIEKDGVGFTADEDALARLKGAGASEAVLEAVKKAGRPSAAPGSAPPVTYQQVLELLRIGIGEDAILKRLEKSPTLFTLDAQQMDDLKTAGASERLLAAMQQGRPVSAAAAEMITDFAIVLDCSGSMKQLTGDGETKMAAAKRVVTDLVQKIPDGKNVTFVIYGHEVYGGADDPRNCRAVKIVRPLSKLDAAGKSELAGFIARLQPTGATPIALSLKTAGEELARNIAFCGLVLITDGLETCKGDPKAEAAALAANLKLTFGVNVVGFGVKLEESAALKEIADAGKGKYYDADSAAKLSDALEHVAADLIRPPKPVPVARRAIKVLKPRIELRACAGIELETVDGVVHTTVAQGNLGDEIRVPSSSQAYQVVWVPAEGKPVVMIKDFTLPERKVVEIKPEDHLGMVRVSGQGAPKERIHAWTKDGIVTTTCQECRKYGQIMVVPAGTYGVSVDDDTIEEGLKVEPGTLHDLQ